ncbi:MAG TPA: PEP/pyruvate-binding domain-containing protein [Propionibacteriaceae bacterium]
MNATYVRDLADEGLGLCELGGKGQSLARLASAGVPVPNGFHITTDAYNDFVAQHDLKGFIKAQLATLNGSAGKATDQVAAAIAAQFAEHEIPTEIAADLLRAYHQLGSPPVAVRSSATAEDLPDASFAGQQETFLNISGDDQLLKAVRRCWASLWTTRAITYRARYSIHAAKISLAVVVQELIEADASGIVFTADPVTGDDAMIEINAAWGLGEAVVGGQVTSDTITVERASGRIMRTVISTKMIMTGLTDGGVASLPVREDQRDASALTDSQVPRLVDLAIMVEDLFKDPMDIEWCRKGDQLFVLQARPITTAIHPDPWNDSRSGDFLWTNTNVGEAIPDVMTPATWSMVQVFLTDAMATASIPPYVGYGRIGGRIYLNLSVTMTLSAAVGVSEKRYRSLTEEVFGKLPADLEIPPVKARRRDIIRAVLPMGVHVLREARRDVKVLDAYLAAHAALCDRRRTEIAAVATAVELADLWIEVLSPEFHRVSWMLSAATRSSGASFITTRKRLQQLVGDAAANALTAGLRSQAGQLASLGLLDGLDQLAAGEIDRETFNRRYGHRGPHEFEMSVPRPGEDPDWIDRQLAERAESATSYRDLLAAQEQKRNAAWAELEQRHPMQAKILHHQLRGWAKISRDRERARSEVIRYFWVLRAYALRAGELTGLGDDIFFLDKAEIVRVLHGETISPKLIKQRHAAYQAYSALPPYPALIRGTFNPHVWAADPNRRSDLFIEGSVNEADVAVRGFPGSAGVVQARVRVLSDAADGAALRPGEVLVTTITNVGWTPLFPRAAAVITDVGAPLSHAAIVARELGIPAVVGCGNATMRLRTGDLVRVDGTAGTVEVLR